MRYQVPQFIEVEDKIIGPFSVKQFVYLVGGVGVSSLVYHYIPSPFSILVIGVVLICASALAFYKINNRPMIVTLEAAFNYLLSSRLYTWRKVPKEIKPKTEKEIIDQAKASLFVPKLSDSKLKDLAWSLDINETIYSRELKKTQGYADNKNNNGPQENNKAPEKKEGYAGYVEQMRRQEHNQTPHHPY